MSQNKMLAMILAGGRGSRLQELTDKVAKPAVFFGGKYRIIDFPLSNCANSDIQVVGVLTQYESVLLNSYVAQDEKWGLDAKNSGVFVLPPREKSDGFGLYRGTADAITQNIDFINQYDPEYVLVLSGDHIYKMDYSKMLESHQERKADVTIAVIEVSLKEASRFGIMNTDEDDRIYEFDEKPEHPKSNLASMGVYIFNWKLLRRALIQDGKDETSHHDFGKNIIPSLLNDNKRLFAYRFKGYWKDVGTIDSLWESNMDLLKVKNKLDLMNPEWRIYTEDVATLPQVIQSNGSVKSSIINQGCVIDGLIENSVIFTNVKVKKGAVIKNSVVMPNVVVGEDAVLDRVLVAPGVIISDKAVIKGKKGQDIPLVFKDI